MALWLLHRSHKDKSNLQHPPFRCVSEIFLKVWQLSFQSVHLRLDHECCAVFEEHWILAPQLVDAQFYHSLISILDTEFLGLCAVNSIRPTGSSALWIDLKYLSIQVKHAAPWLAK